MYVNYSFCQCWAQFCKEITGKEYLKYNLTCKGIKITPCGGRGGSKYCFMKLELSGIFSCVFVYWATAWNEELTVAKP